MIKIREKLLSVLIRWFGAAVHPLRQAYRLNVPQVANPVNTNDATTQPENATATPKISGLALSRVGEMGYRSEQPVAGFALPQLPVGVLPEQGLAQDAAALQLAQDNAAFCFAYANSTQGGMGFKGYPVLAELSQRSEYRSPTETLATEMTRQWISFKCIGSENRSEQLKAIEAAFDQFKIRDKLKQAVEHDGFFGRGMLFVDMGDAALNSTPLIINPATIKQGGLKGFKVIEPMWTSPSQYNAIDPTAKDFYQPSAWYVMGKQVHASRLLLFIARPLPDMLKPAYNFSGLSMTQLLEPAVNAWLRTRDSVSELVHCFSTSGLKTDMQAVLAGGTGDDIINRAQFFNQMRDNRGLMLLDKDNEEFFQFHTPLGGLDRLQAQAQEQMAAPSHIPLVKLFGITPNGLNASSEGEIKVFYDYVQAMQQTLFTDPLVKLLQIIQLHLFGEIYDDITFEYCPLEQMNDEQELNISKGKAEMGATLIQAGVISKEEERQRLAGDPLSGYDGLSEQLPEQSNEGEQAQQAGADPAMDDLLGDWKEFLHPRDENGRWTDKFGGAVGLSSSMLEDIRKKRDPYGKLDTASTGNSAGSKTGRQQGQSHITRPTDPIRLADGSVVRGNEKYVPYDGKYFYNEKTKKWVKIHEAKPVDKAYLKLKDDNKKKAVSTFSLMADNTGLGVSFTGAALANLTARNPNSTSENVIGAYKTGAAISNLIGAPQATGLKTKPITLATAPKQPIVSRYYKTINNSTNNKNNFMDSVTASGATVHHSPISTAIGDDIATTNNFRNAIASKNGHNVIAHGQLHYDEFGGIPVINGRQTHPAQIAEAVRSNPHYIKGTPVCFASCWSATSGSAQHLADELNAIVFAPTRPVAWSLKRNKWVFDTDLLSAKPVDNPEIKSEWQIFYPTKR